MDDAVRLAMAKWPDVPAVFGWLALDARGRWLIQGERIVNSRFIEYIGRNYGVDGAGRWFFQNGPQRVFVTLACSPWILRWSHRGQFDTHTGKAVNRVRCGWIDRQGIVVLETEYGAGAVDDRDLEAVSELFVDAAGESLVEDALAESLDRFQAGTDPGTRLRYAGSAVPLHPILATDIPSRLCFVRDPRPMPDTRASV